LLVLALPDGQATLPVFGLEEEAGMFLWLETAGEGWRVAQISEADLAALLRDACAEWAGDSGPRGFPAGAVGREEPPRERGRA